MSRVIGVLSGKGGVGKTTVVSNLGAVLTHDFRKNVLIFDSNLKTSHLGLHLGIYNQLSITLEDVLKKNIPPMQAIFIHPTTGMRLMPAPLAASDVKITKLKNVIDELKENYEIIVIDCAPGLGKEVMTAIKCIDEAIIITTPDLPAVTDALKTIDVLERLHKKILGIVLNKVRNESFELTSSEIESTCGCKVISTIPDSLKIPESISKGIPVTIYAGNSGVAVALKTLGAYLIGEEYLAPTIWDRLKSIFGFSGDGVKAYQAPVQMPATEKKISRFKKNKKMKEEVADIKKLKEEISEEVKEEVKKSVKEDILKRVKEKLEERM